MSKACLMRLRFEISTYASYHHVSFSSYFEISKFKLSMRIQCLTIKIIAWFQSSISEQFAEGDF